MPFYTSQPDISALLGAAPVQPPQGVPTSGMPGGSAKESQDPAAYGAQVTVAALRQLAGTYRQIGEERLGNFVDGLAVRLNKEHIKRQQELRKAFEQAATVGMSAVA